MLKFRSSEITKKPIENQRYKRRFREGAVLFEIAPAPLETTAVGDRLDFLHEQELQFGERTWVIRLATVKDRTLLLYCDQTEMDRLKDRIEVAAFARLEVGEFDITGGTKQAIASAVSEAVAALYEELTAPKRMMKKGRRKRPLQGLDEIDDLDEDEDEDEAM